MYIHIVDRIDNNVRMILPPAADGQVAGDDILVTYTVDGVGNPTSMAFDGTHIHIADESDDNMRMILPPAADGQVAGDDILFTYTVDGVGNPTGMVFDGTHIHIADSSDDNVRMILPPAADDVAPVVYTYTVDGLNRPTGMAFDGTHIHIADEQDNNVRMILPPAADGVAPVVYTYTVDGLNDAEGMAFDGTHIHIADEQDDNVRMILPPAADGVAPVVYTYTVDGLNNVVGMTFDGAIQSQATLTISTTDTDIREGEAVDIDIDSDADVSDFIASDITVTGGTRGTLTENSATSYTLRVTAGSAGTMAVSIAEDVVPEGNVAASEDFTINARATATITFDDASGESGGDTGVNINFGESVSGLQLAHLSASSGTLSNLTGSGTSWEADLDFPATGMGTVTVTLAEDSVIPQNAEAEASIDYDEPLELGWTVPTDPTDNTFPVTLTSNHELTGVVIADFRLRIHDNSEAVIILDATNATLTAVSGTNNWRLDISLTGTFDADYTVRVRRNSLMFDGMNVPSPALASAAFAIDTSLGVDAVLDITLDATSVEQNEIVNATFTFDKAVGDFTAADVTVSAGSKGALTDNGDNTYSMPITAPATGSGDVDIDVAADVVTPGNNSDTASFAYTEPVVALSFGSEAIGNQAWVVGTADSITLPEATGGSGTITYSLSPTLPSGKTFTAGTRVLDGNPTGRFSVATFTYTATDADSNTVELTFTAVVTAIAITIPNIPNQTWTVGTAVFVTLPEASGGVGAFTYSLSPTLPAGVSRTNRAVTGNPTAAVVVATYTYTAEDSEGITQEQTFTIVVVAAPVITVPSAPTSLTLTKTHNSISATFAAPTDLGGGVLSRYDIRIDSGAWVDTGLDLAHTFGSLEAETEYTVEVAGVNSAGRGAIASLNATTNAAVVVGESNLTGSGVQVGSAVQFGIGFGGPSALASDGTTVFMFHLRRGYTLNPITGVAVQVGGNNLGLSFNPRLSAAMYHNGEIIVHGTQNDELYSFDTTTYTLTAIGTGITIAGSGSSPVITGMTSLGGIIYVAEAFTDALMILDESNSVLTPVDADTVGYGLDSPNIQSLGAYKGMLVGVNIDSTAADIRLVELSTTDGSATEFNNVVPPDNAITGMVEHDDQLLAAGNDDDALFRMYDVLWDGTIDDLEVDEGDNETWSLSDISQDADTFSLPSSPPSWLSVSGDDLVATTAPDVNADQNNDVTVRATRDSIDVDEIIRVVVKNTVAPPPTNNAPVFGESSYAFTDVAIAVNTVVGTVAATDADNDTLTYSLTGTDASTFAIDANGQITVAVALTHSEAYSFNVVADDGTDTTSVGVSATAIVAPTPPTFTAPTSDYEVVERADATIDSTEFFTGHSSLAFDEDYTAPSWITVSGLDVVVTSAPSVTDDTDYTVELTATNADGDVDGSITVSVQQIDPAPIIGALSRIDINEGESDTVDLSGSLQNTDDLVITSGESWVSVSGLSLVITDAPDVTTDTDYTVNLRAESDATSETDTGSVVIRVADVPPSTEIDTASLANQTLILFEKERNHTTTPAEAGDNDRSTSTSESTVVCDIQDLDENDTDFDHIFVRCSGADAYELSLDGVSQGLRTLPTEIQVSGAEPAIADVSITRDGYQHDLLALETALTGASVSLTFTGSDIKINEVLILNRSVVTNQNYARLDHSKIDVNSNLDQGQSGEVSRTLSARGDRLRWRSDCSVEFVSVDEDSEAFLNWINENPHVVVAHDPQLFPWRVYRARFLGSRYNIPYVSKVLDQGESLSFQIQENRPIGSQLAVDRKETFNTEDSKEHHLFFNHCVHLNNGRVTTASGSIERRASDNRPRTFSTETTLSFDISKNTESTKVTHIWLKATGVTSYAVQTLLSNTWTTQETVTPTQTNYTSWDNSLEKLTTAITATRVRLVFAGSDIKISEVLLLRLSGGLRSIREITPVKTDRSSVVSDSESGDIQNRPLGADSLKWELDFSAVFTELHTSEDFIDWADANPNFTFAERPKSKPWRVYPATFLSDAFNISLLSDTIQVGEVLQFQIGER